MPNKPVRVAYTMRQESCEPHIEQILKVISIPHRSACELCGVWRAGVQRAVVRGTDRSTAHGEHRVAQCERVTAPRLPSSSPTRRSIAGARIGRPQSPAVCHRCWQSKPCAPHRSTLEGDGLVAGRQRLLLSGPRGREGPADRGRADIEPPVHQDGGDASQVLLHGGPERKLLGEVAGRGRLAHPPGRAAAARRDENEHLLVALGRRDCRGGAGRRHEARGGVALPGGRALAAAGHLGAIVWPPKP
mmetsp:Transcript_30861/g.81770  ORF Transcript_30861/g.81770 Transcript_30861/m.81770 type:complete len:246 (-) Transcript_30861:113-850(-)